jgi:hypothetical protein
MHICLKFTSFDPNMKIWMMKFSVPWFISHIDIRYNDKNVRTFAELYIAGNIIALGATGFFIGFRNMCHKMVAKTRRVGTAVWLSFMIGVFVAAMLRAPLPIVLLLLLCEVLAGMRTSSQPFEYKSSSYHYFHQGIWYAASYIPFGRKMIVGCCQASLFSPCPEACKPLADQV